MSSISRNDVRQEGPVTVFHSYGEKKCKLDISVGEPLSKCRSGHWISTGMQCLVPSTCSDIQSFTQPLQLQLLWDVVYLHSRAHRVTTMRSDRWHISKSELKEAIRHMAPGSHPTQEQVLWLERLCIRATNRLPNVPRLSTKYPGRISHGYKKALRKATERACCKQDIRFAGGWLW